MEHRIRESKTIPASSRSISDLNSPVQRAAFKPENSSVSAQFCERTRPFLLDGALPAEFLVTNSKQRVGKFLPDTRTHISIFGIWPISAPFCKRTRPFLTESAPQVEFGVTRSKQRTGEFLTEARTHIKNFETSLISADNLALTSSNLNRAKLSEGIAWLRQ